VIRHFVTDPDGRVSILGGDAIVTYPHHEYRDLVSYDGESYESGILTKIFLSWGSAYKVATNYVLDDLMIDYEGRSLTGDAYFLVHLYVNSESEPFHTKRFPVDRHGVMVRSLPPRGRIRNLRVEIEIPEEHEDNVQEFNISKVAVGVAERQNVGNR
jgi:hypothetical protein